MSEEFSLIEGFSENEGRQAELRGSAGFNLKPPGTMQIQL